MQNNSAGWIKQYQKKGALWIHDGNPKRPHALLTLGMHSDGFFNSGLVIEDSFLLDFAAQDLVEQLQQKDINVSKIDRVVGPAMGAITLAHDVARHITKIKGQPCLCGYTEKEGSGPGDLMVLKRTTIFPGERVLLVEDVLTTGGSMLLAEKAIQAVGAIVQPCIAVLVNRTHLLQLGETKIISLINHPMSMWAPANCPLCKQGSKAIRPKGKENWDRLNAVY